jgi:hypothetical protein
MPALVAGIHVLNGSSAKKDVDGRDKPGHDGWACFGQNRKRTKLLFSLRFMASPGGGAFSFD